MGVCIGSHFVGACYEKKKAIIVHDFANPQAKMVTTSYIPDHNLSSHPGHAHGVVVVIVTKCSNHGRLIPRKAVRSCFTSCCPIKHSLASQREQRVSTHLTKLLIFFSWPCGHRFLFEEQHANAACEYRSRAFFHHYGTSKI